MAYVGIRQPYLLLGYLMSANMNSTADQAISLKSLNCVIQRVLVTNASTNLTLAAGGFYTAASKGGTAIVGAGQTYSSLTGNTIALNATIAALLRNTAQQIFFSLTTAQGGAATADIYIYGEALDL